MSEFKNARIHDLNGDFEAIFSRKAWRMQKGDGEENEVIRSPRGMSENVKENRKKTIRKAKTRMRRLIKTHGLERLVTLTFKRNLQDVKEADKEFRKFMKRLMRRFPELKYLAVREFQMRGAVHYHLAINIYIDQKDLEEIWGQGFVWIEKKHGDTNMMASYMTKYITKHSEDERLKSQNIYLRSQNMELKHEDHIFEDVEEMLDYLVLRYPDEMRGKVRLDFEEEGITWVG